MSKLRVHAFSISIDGYGAGPDQSLQHPLGVGGPAMFDWFFHTRTWRRMHGHEDKRRRFAKSSVARDRRQSSPQRRSIRLSRPSGR